MNLLYFADFSFLKWFKEISHLKSWFCPFLELWVPSSPHVAPKGGGSKGGQSSMYQSTLGTITLKLRQDVFWSWILDIWPIISSLLNPVFKRPFDFCKNRYRIARNKSILMGFTVPNTRLFNFQNAQYFEFG